MNFTPFGRFAIPSFSAWGAFPSFHRSSIPAFQHFPFDHLGSPYLDHESGRTKFLVMSTAPRRWKLRSEVLTFQCKRLYRSADLLVFINLYPYRSSLVRAKTKATLDKASLLFYVISRVFVKRNRWSSSIQLAYGVDFTMKDLTLHMKLRLKKARFMIHWFNWRDFDPLGQSKNNGRTQWRTLQRVFVVMSDSCCCQGNHKTAVFGIKATLLKH